MTQCITIASWMLAVIGIVLTILGYIKLKHDNDYHPHDCGTLTIAAAFAFVGGITIAIVGAYPYFQYVSCIQIIP